MDQIVRSCVQSMWIFWASQPVLNPQNCGELLVFGVEKKRKRVIKFVGAAIIFLTLASTVVVVAQSCHESKNTGVVAAVTTHAGHATHNHSPLPSATGGLTSGGLLTEICTGIFYLVLIIGGRFLLRIFQNRFREKILVFYSHVYAFRQRIKFNLTLSLPQLGICRI